MAGLTGLESTVAFAMLVAMVDRPAAYKKCLFAKALPAPDFKYFSKTIALDSFLKAI
jgi:hypothetical protein